MSDLQCAVTVIVLPSGAENDVEALRRERPAQLLTLAGDGAALARELGVAVHETPGDGPAGVGDLTRLVGDLADEYRGECVVVVVEPDLFADLTGQVLPARAQARGAVVRVDADSQRWSPWPSAPPQ